jgi:uncharacterized protein (TIGR02147 family)
MIEKKDFKSYLQNKLVERCQDDARYSLRTFAKDLNVSPSALSAMINGKRRITERSKQQFGLKLGLSREEIQSLFPADSEELHYEQLTLDSFAVISDWYHFAILELMRVKSFKSNCSWVSKRLGVSTQDIALAVERLERLGMIEINEDGDWIDVSSGFTTNIEDGLTSLASQKFQQQLLEKAILAIKNTSLDKRDHTSMTMAINTQDIPKAKELLKDFRRSFNQLLDSSARPPNEVYNLCMAFYPLSINPQEK